MSVDSSVTWHLVPARENFYKYKRSWDRLNQRYLQSHPMGDSCFVEALVEHYADNQVFLAIKSDGTEQVCMLMLRPGKFGVVESFCPAQTELCPILIPSAHDLQTLIHDFPLSTLLLELYRQDPDYSVFPDSSSGLTYEIDVRATTACVDLNDDFPTYWDARSSKLRKNIGKILRTISEPRFNWKFSIVETPADVEDAIVRYGDLEVQGWKHAEGTAVHSTNKQGQFYRDIMCGFAERNKGIVYELYFDDILVSSQMAIGNDNCLITLKTTYNESFAEYSPGKLVDYFMLQHEFELKRYSRIEFCTNAGPELIRWSTSNRPVSDISVYRNVLAQRLSRFYRKLKQLTP